MPFQSNVYINQALGKPGTIARLNPIDKIPVVAEGTAVFAGGFVFEGTDPERQVVGASDATASVTAVAGVAVFEKFQMALRAANDIASLNINPGEELAKVRKGYVYIQSSTASVHGQKVFVNTTTGVISTGTGDAPSGSIDTGWTVETGNAAGETCEIYNI